MIFSPRSKSLSGEPYGFTVNDTLRNELRPRRSSIPGKDPFPINPHQSESSVRHAGATGDLRSEDRQRDGSDQKRTYVSTSRRSRSARTPCRMGQILLAAMACERSHRSGIASSARSDSHLSRSAAEERDGYDVHGSGLGGRRH